MKSATRKNDMSSTATKPKLDFFSAVDEFIDRQIDGMTDEELQAFQRKAEEIKNRASRKTSQTTP